MTSQCCVLDFHHIGSTSDDDAKNDLHGLNEDQLHPWLLWRGLVLTHACQCRLPLSVCAVPHCSVARRRVLSKEDMRTGERLVTFHSPNEAQRRQYRNNEISYDSLFIKVHYAPASPPSAEIASTSQSSRWAVEVCQEVETLLEAHATQLDGKHRDFMKLKSKHQIVHASEVSRAASGSALGSHPAHQSLVNIEVQPRESTARQPPSTQSYKQVSAYLSGLSDAAETDPERHTALHGCLISLAEADQLAREVSTKRRMQATAKLTIPRALVALLICRDSACDVRGTSTGVKANKVGNQGFSGNDSFFAWLLSRMRLEQKHVQRATSHTARGMKHVGIGKLRFDSEHGRSAACVSGDLLLLCVSQPAPSRKIIQEVHTTTDQSDLGAELRIDDSTTTVAIASHMEEITDPGLLVETTLPGACDNQILALSRKMLDAAMPLQGQRGGHALMRLISLVSRADLAAWLLQRASLVMESRGNCLRLKSRRVFMAVATAFPPKQIIPRSQRSPTKRAGADAEGRPMVKRAWLDADEDEDDLSGGESDENTLGAYQQQTFIRRTIALRRGAPAFKRAQVGARLLRVREARIDLTCQRYLETPTLLSVVAREWRAMANEDSVARALQPYLAAPHARVKTFKPAFEFTLRRAAASHRGAHDSIPPSQHDLIRVAELDVFFKSLLVEEDASDAKHSDNLAVQDELEAARKAVEQGNLTVPFFLGKLAVYWLASQGARSQRRVRRKELRQFVWPRVETEIQDVREHDANPAVGVQDSSSGEKKATARGRGFLRGIGIFRSKSRAS